CAPSSRPTECTQDCGSWPVEAAGVPGGTAELSATRPGLVLPPRQSSPSARPGKQFPMRLASRAAALAVLLLVAALPARPGTLDAASIHETVFPNGLRLVTREAHGADLVAVQVWVRAGGFLEEPANSGFAHVIEHLVFRGTEKRGPGTVDQEVEDLGGELTAMTEKDWTMFGTTVASQHAMKIVD